jgi:hypothetical protein
MPRVPYQPHGRGLALAVREAFGDRPVRGAVLLESSGVIAYADSIEEATAMTRELDERARAEIGTSLSDIDDRLRSNLSEGEEIDVPGGRARPLRRRRVSGRYLFPDAALFAEHRPVTSVGLASAELALRERSRPTILFDALGERWAVARTSEQLAFAVEVTTAHDWLEEALVARALARYLTSD